MNLCVTEFIEILTRKKSKGNHTEIVSLIFLVLYRKFRTDYIFSQTKKKSITLITIKSQIIQYSFSELFIYLIKNVIIS